MKYHYRNIKPEDYETVCRLPQTEEELFFMFPKADFPLTTEQLAENLKIRYSPTVFLDGIEIIGFANYYHVKENESAWIGNLIVRSSYRGKGTGSFIVEIMENQSIEIYGTTEMRLSCFSDNIPALGMYHKLGYIPFGMEEWNCKYSRRFIIHMKKNLKPNTYA